MTVQRGAFQTEEAARVPSFLWTTSLPPACLYPGLCPHLSKYVSLCCFKPSTVLGEEHTFLSTVYNILFNPFTSPNSLSFLPLISLAPATVASFLVFGHAHSSPAYCSLCLETLPRAYHMTGSFFSLRS